MKIRVNDVLTIKWGNKHIEAWPAKDYDITRNYGSMRVIIKESVSLITITLRDVLKVNGQWI